MPNKLFREIPSEHYFFARNEMIIKSLSELCDALNNMDDHTYMHHVNKERNDFSEWIKDVIGDKKLAKGIRKAKTKEEVSKFISMRLERARKKEDSVKSVEKEIEKVSKEPEKAEKLDESIEIPLDKLDEVLQREKEIEKREEKIKEIEDKIEKDLEALKKKSKKKETERGFFSKEFIQGIAVGVLVSVIVILIYVKFFA